jgi:methylmalonyl-CoA/ethylmalonyl-CoA epimerase
MLERHSTAVPVLTGKKHCVLPDLLKEQTMFDKIQHIGYLVADLDAAVQWFKDNFGGENAGGSNLGSSVAVPGGGRNAFIHFGQVEAELIQPNDTGGLPQDGLVMHHVGYVVSDILRIMPQLQARGFKFAADAPFTNVLGQQVLYLDPTTTNGVLLHLTQQPQPPNLVGVGQGVAIDKIIHAGYLVPNLDEAIAWYETNLDGVHIGGGASRRGGRNAFVNFGQVQVELIEPGDPASLGQQHSMDHVGYVVSDIGAGIDDCCNRGFQFVADAANTNTVGQQVLYFDTASTQGSRMHLTQLPPD